MIEWKCETIDGKTTWSHTDVSVTIDCEHPMAIITYEPDEDIYVWTVDVGRSFGGVDGESESLEQAMGDTLAIIEQLRAESQ